MKLFDEKVDLALPDSKINYYSNFLNKEEADFYFHELKSHVSWRQDEITVYGKTYYIAMARIVMAGIPMMKRNWVRIRL